MSVSRSMFYLLQFMGVFSMVIGRVLANVSLHPSQQLVTSGVSFNSIFEQEGKGDSTFEQLMAFSICGADASCTHVVKQRRNRGFEFITSKDISPLMNDRIVAIWKKSGSLQKRNIAYKRDTSSSESDKDSSRAVDGSRDNNYFGPSCFGAKWHVENPWWRVAFGAPVFVHSVAITNSGGASDGTGAFLTSIDIRIGHKDKRGANPICRHNVSIEVAATANFECKGNSVGSFLFIERHQKILNICEVEVFGAFVY